MKTETKAQLRQQLNDLGGVLNKITAENITLRAKLAAYEKLAGIPADKFFTARYTIEVVRQPRPARAVAGASGKQPEADADRI